MDAAVDLQLISCCTGDNAIKVLHRGLVLHFDNRVLALRSNVNHLKAVFLEPSHLAWHSYILKVGHYSVSFLTRQVSVPSTSTPVPQVTHRVKSIDEFLIDGLDLGEADGSVRELHWLEWGPCSESIVIRIDISYRIA